MIPGPPRYTRRDTRLPYQTLVLSEWDLQRLRESMPNFATVMDAIEPVLQLQRGGDRALRLPPLLLLGPPGVGKSYFAERLAQTLRLHYVAISLETTTAVWVLSGSRQGWSGGGPGIVFDTLAIAPPGKIGRAHV